MALLLLAFLYVAAYNFTINMNKKTDSQLNDAASVCYLAVSLFLGLLYIYLHRGLLSYFLNFFIPIK